MIFNLENDLEKAINYLLTKQDKKVDIIVKNNTRTNAQNSARWLWLEMIASELNERGETFEAKGLKVDVPFTKDNLYHIYWQTLRLTMYPKKEIQLNTNEFSKLVEHAEMMFAKIFDIQIPFPNYLDLIHKKDVL